MPQPDCPILLNGCPGVDAPITNISAEAADTFQWAAQIWSPWDPYRPPPLGDGQSVKQDCSALAGELFSNFDPIVFADTQAMANIIALGQSLGCPWNIPEVSGITLQNDAQSATVTCPDGSSFTYQVEAGLYQIDAAILCGYPTDTVIFVKSGSVNQTITHTGCFVQFTYDQLLGASTNSATWLCVDGHSITNSVGGGYVSAASQACAAWIQMANDWAQAEALYQATSLMDCITKDDPPAPGSDPPALTPGPGILTTPTWVCRGEDFFSSYNISGRGSADYTIEVISGTLPPGLTFTQTDPKRATLSGTTTTAGEYTFTIKGTATLAPYSVVQATVTVFVFGLVSDLLPDATSGTAYSETLSADGGTSPYTFALDPDSDPIPTGLTLSSDGTLSGTPTVDGDFSFDVIVTDSTGGECVQTIGVVVQPSGSVCASCAWTDVLGGLIDPGGCGASANPAWDGVFDLTTNSGVPFNFPIWYFIDRSILGLPCSASDGPNYPGGDWRNLDTFTSLYWLGASWELFIVCSSGSLIWEGTGGANILDPSGDYNYVGGSSIAIPTIRVNAHGTGYCLGVPTPATWSAPQPTRLRIRDYATVLAAFGLCPNCDTATVEPAWNGEMPTLYSPNNTTQRFMPLGFDGSESSNQPALSVANRVIENGSNNIVEIGTRLIPGVRWEFYIICVPSVNPNRLIWEGYKTVGLTAEGGYVRTANTLNGPQVASGPACIEIESY